MIHNFDVAARSGPLKCRSRYHDLKLWTRRIAVIDTATKYPRLLTRIEVREGMLTTVGLLSAEIREAASSGR